MSLCARGAERMLRLCEGLGVGTDILRHGEGGGCSGRGAHLHPGVTPTLVSQGLWASPLAEVTQVGTRVYPSRNEDPLPVSAQDEVSPTLDRLAQLPHSTTTFSFIYFLLLLFSK